MEAKPKIIMVGWHTYPRVIDFADSGRSRTSAALLVADSSRIAGLVASGVHPSPFPHAHIVTTTTHKTLRTREPG